jgi:hypothetical protein
MEKFHRQTVYYFSYSDKTQAFPEGFHMVVGNPGRRAWDEPVINQPWTYPIDDPQKQENLAKESIGFLCIEYQDLGTFQRKVMFTREEMDKCTGGFQANIATRGCWNGQESPPSPHDMSHLAYSGLVLDGPCPPTHPIRLPTLLFETTYETQKFRGVPGYYMFNTGDKEGIMSPHLPRINLTRARIRLSRRRQDRLEEVHAAAGARHVHVHKRHDKRVPRLHA